MRPQVASSSLASHLLRACCWCFKILLLFLQVHTREGVGVAGAYL